MAGANKKGGNMRVDYYLGEDSLILDECQSKLQEVDDYWDRENEYIKTCGIYTPDFVMVGQNLLNLFRGIDTTGFDVLIFSVPVIINLL